MDEMYDGVTLELDAIPDGTDPIAVYATQKTPQRLTVGHSLWRLLANGSKQVPGFDLRLQK
jgi:hypothetical protein